MKSSGKKNSRFQKTAYVLLTGLLVLTAVVSVIWKGGVVSAAHKAAGAASAVHKAAAVPETKDADATPGDEVKIELLREWDNWVTNAADEHVSGTVSLPVPGKALQLSSNQGSVTVGENGVFATMDNLSLSPGDNIFITDTAEDAKHKYAPANGGDIIIANESDYTYRINSNAAENNGYNSTYVIVADDPYTRTKLVDGFKDFLKAEASNNNNNNNIFMKGNKYYVGNETGENWELEGLADENHLAVYDFREGSAAPNGVVTILNELWQGYMEDKADSGEHVEVYNPNSGVKIPQVTKKQYITIIRWDVSDYVIQAGKYKEGTSIREVYYHARSTVPLISVNSHPIEIKTALDPPKVKSENQEDYSPESTNSVFKNARVSLAHALQNEDSSKLQLNYYLSSTDYGEAIQNRSFASITAGAAITLQGRNMSGNRRYLYVMTQPLVGKAEDYFKNSKTRSQIIKYEFSFDKAKPDGKIVFRQVDAAEGAEAEGVDVGEATELVWQAAQEGDTSETIILYTRNGTVPTLSFFTGDSSVTLDTLEAAAENVEGEDSNNKVVYLTSVSDRNNFLRVNNYWYKCSKSVLKYSDTEPIVVGKECRADGRIQVQAMAVQAGKELGDYKRLTLPLKLKTTVQNPTADIATTMEEPKELEMGAIVNFSCLEPDSELFYTVDGSKPMVTVKAGTVEPVPANGNTYKLNIEKGVTITEKLASYGSDVTFRVLAVCYEDGYRKKNDSEIVSFVYHIKAKPAVEKVEAVPATDAAEPVVLEEGSRISLHCNTPGASIYYTIDGTEPQRKEDGTPAKNTFEYNAAKGVVVPAQTDTLFTITAIAYKEGYEASELARFVYKYPAALPAPYATPGSATVTEGTSVILKSSTEGAIIYYEIAYDGKKPAKPTENSKVFDAENPIIITRDTRVKAVAIKDGRSSAVNEFSYKVSTKLSAPVPSINSGAVISSGTSITLTAEEGATVYYTTDGSNPADTENTMVSVGNTVFLEGTEGSVITIRTYATKTGYSNSEVANYSYSFSNYENALLADKENGSTLKNGEIVTLNTDVTNAEIYYTLDGSNPTTASNRGNRVTIMGEAGSTVVLKAMAIIPGAVRASATATYTYTISQKLKAPTSNVPSGQR